MLTLEEAGLTLRAIKIFSILNILPIQVDVKSGRIERQSSKIRVFIWKLLFGISLSHWVYSFARLAQSTVIEPEKYFRWDHFVIHFGSTFASAVFYFTGFRLFVKNPEENVIIFNQLFEEREDPVQKIIDQSRQRGLKNDSASAKQGNKTRGKSGTQLVSTSKSARGPHEEIEMDVLQNQSESETEILPRPLLTWPPQYSLDEILVKLLSLAAPFTTFCAVLILAIDPTRPQLLFSALRPGYQNVWSFLTLLAVETLWVVVLIFTGSFAVGTQVLFFGKCHLELKRMSLQLRNLRDSVQDESLGIEIGGQEIRREIWILRHILKEMKQLVLFIELFNRCFPFCILAWKLLCLSMTILFYFFVIRHVEDFPFLGVFSGYCATTMTVFYTIMYGHAFSIPGKMEELKEEFLLTAKKTTANVKADVNKIVQAEMKREIKGIRGVGIKVGNFNEMERESTPIFIDFVLQNVVDLLVTFPR